MISENSGKFYRFKLDHDLGFGFAEVYDFTEDSDFDGRIAYVFNKHDQDEKSSYELSQIRESGIALGPMRLNKFPNTKGLHSWKYIAQADNLLIDQLPETKELQGLLLDNNWDNFKGKWYNSNYDKKELPTYVDYEKVRHLETRILNTPSGVVTKFTMKVILDRKEKVSDYYNLSELGTKNMFVQMVNTYFPLHKTKTFLQQLPTMSK